MNTVINESNLEAQSNQKITRKDTCGLYNANNTWGKSQFDYPVRFPTLIINSPVCT